MPNIMFHNTVDTSGIPRLTGVFDSMLATAQCHKSIGLHIVPRKRENLNPNYKLYCIHLLLLHHNRGNNFGALRFESGELYLKSQITSHMFIFFLYSSHSY